MTEKDKKESPPDKQPAEDKGLTILNRIIATLILILMLFMLGFCVRVCSEGSSYDDTWDRIEHKVNSDSYFKQW